MHCCSSWMSTWGLMSRCVHLLVPVSCPLASCSGTLANLCMSWAKIRTGKQYASMPRQGLMPYPCCRRICGSMWQVLSCISKTRQSLGPCMYRQHVPTIYRWPHACTATYWQYTLVHQLQSTAHGAEVKCKLYICVNVCITMSCHCIISVLMHAVLLPGQAVHEAAWQAAVQASGVAGAAGAQGRCPGAPQVCCKMIPFAECRLMLMYGILQPCTRTSDCLCHSMASDAALACFPKFQYCAEPPSACARVCGQPAP